MKLKRSELKTICYVYCYVCPDADIMFCEWDSACCIICNPQINVSY